MPRFVSISVLAAALMLAGACAKKPRAPVAAAPIPSAAWPVKSPDFIDLLPGWRVRETTPILASGNYVVNGSVQEQQGTTITLSGSDFQGYETALYAIKPMAAGGATAELTSVVTTMVSKGGDRKINETTPRAPLFPFPRSVGYIRLLYLIRVSGADHNMAVLGSDNVDQLNELTQQVQHDPPGGCRNTEHAYCNWVPQGIAVDPEIWAIADRGLNSMVDTLPPLIQRALDPTVKEWVPAR